MFTIVMYHYVRDLEGSRYPAIRGLTPARFEWQLAYLCRHYHMLNAPELNHALITGAELPEKSCLLTFDDGLRDHYNTVFPLLRAHGVSGCFFPPAKAICMNHVLDVHKIHFILAAVPDRRLVLQALRQALADLQGRPGIPTVRELEAQFLSGNRLNDPEERFIKYVLQKGLPRAHREAICDELFRRFVTRDEATFASELYVSAEQLREMREADMEIGGHGYCHDWLGTLSKEEQEADIAKCVAFLATIQQRQPVQWIMTYPSGSYNAQTIEILRRYGCVAACTSQSALADPRQPFELHRRDTIDLPLHDVPTEPTSVKT